MTMPEFEAAFNPVVEEYDKDRKHYGPRRIKAIYEAFKHMPVQRFKLVVNRVFASERYAPMASQLRQIADQIQIEEHQKLKRVFAPRAEIRGVDLEKAGELAQQCIATIRPKPPTGGGCGVNFLEALKSGKKFKRRHSKEWLIAENKGLVSNGFFTNLMIDDFLANDWEIEEEEIFISLSKFVDAWKSAAQKSKGPFYGPLYSEVAKELGLIE